MIELLITIVLIGIVSLIFLVFFKSSLFTYLDLQKDASSMTSLNHQAYRISSVLRGSTQITSAAANELELYAYFYPSDTYVSLVRYYVAMDGSKKQLRADLTPMSSNPPLGTPLTANTRSLVIIDDLYQPSGVDLFAYLNAGGTPISLPISDTLAIKGVSVTLASKTARDVGGGNQTMKVQVSLRNRKTNL